MKSATEILRDYSIDIMRMDDHFNCQLLAAMERYAEQFAASPLLPKDNNETVYIETPISKPPEERSVVFCILKNGLKISTMYVYGRFSTYPTEEVKSWLKPYTPATVATPPAPEDKNKSNIVKDLDNTLCIVATDVTLHLEKICNYLRGEHNHETDAIQRKEDEDLFKQTERLIKIIAPLKTYTNSKDIKAAPSAPIASIKDYIDVIESHKALVKELDVIINGENAAQQPSLCDIVSQLKKRI